jgi:hypothetical protein
VIDARQGVVRLGVVADAQGHIAAGEFTGALFRFAQHAAKKPSTKIITDLALAGGDFADCPPGAISRSDATASRRRVVRYMEAKASGNFNVVGRSASGVERGTEWKTVDTCNTTEVRVRAGSVKVTDLVLHKTVVVRAGQTYVARRRPAA